jgi:hypothetical protein
MLTFLDSMVVTEQQLMNNNNAKRMKERGGLGRGEDADSTVLYCTVHETDDK